MITSRAKRYIVYSLFAAFGLGLVVAFIAVPISDLQNKTNGINEVGPCRQRVLEVGRVFRRPGDLRSFVCFHDKDGRRQGRFVALTGCLQIDPPHDGDTGDWCRRVYHFFLSQKKPNAHRAEVMPGSPGNGNGGGLPGPSEGGSGGGTGPAASVGASANAQGVASAQVGANTNGQASVCVQLAQPCGG